MDPSGSSTRSRNSAPSITAPTPSPAYSSKVWWYGRGQVVMWGGLRGIGVGVGWGLVGWQGGRL